MTRPLLAALALCVCLANGVLAQVVPRNIPADAARGKIEAASASLVQIDGKTLRFAPGARILNQRNLTVTPNMIAPGAPARYVLDARGQVRAVWLVDERESAVAAPVQRSPAAP